MDTCIIGLGNHCNNIFPTLSSIYNITTICDITEDNIVMKNNETIKYKFIKDYNKILNNSKIKNIVSVVNSNYQGDLALEAVKCFKNIIVEKPQCNDYILSSKILKIAKKNNVSLYCGLCRLYDNKLIKKVKSYIQDKKIKNILINVKQTKKFNENKYGLEPPSFHEIYMVLHLFNDNPKRIENIKKSNKINNKYYNYDFVLYYDSNRKIIFKFENNQDSKKHTSINVKTDSKNINLYDGFNKSLNSFKLEHEEFLKDTLSENKNYYNFILATKALYIINKVQENYIGDLNFDFIST